MSLLDSFTVYHIRMAAPAVRVAKTTTTTHGDTITVFNLRFYRQNKEVMSERGIHNSYVAALVFRFHALPSQR